MPEPKPQKASAWIATTAIVLLLTGLSYGGYRFYDLNLRFKNTSADLQGKIATLEGSLALSQEENRSLSEALYSEQQKNALFESQIQEIAGTVGTLDKLAKTDPELLQKYSKVFFLNEHYTPSAVKKIDTEFIYKKDDEEFIHAEVASDLRNLFRAAKKDDVELLALSAYRSFDEQTELKSNYTVTYGTGANAFSADQGYSEHQLGTTLDFTTETLGTALQGFEASEGFTWLRENAYKYGFILSYPKNNAYYQFEPWHWRYVGEALASKLQRENEYFYDMDQREIDEYLVEIFD